MKPSSKNEAVLLELVNKIQVQLNALDKKLDTLVSRSLAQVRPSTTPTAINANMPAKPNDHNKARTLHQAICADCKKECAIPFKPSGDRPVYCQECFSRRKVISMSRIGLDEQPKDSSPTQLTVNKGVDAAKTRVKSKKKTSTAKKTVAKKKTVPKKK